MPGGWSPFGGTMTLGGKQGFMNEGGVFTPFGSGPMTRVPVQNWFDAQRIQNMGGMADQRSGFGMLPNPTYQEQQQQTSQQDIDAMIKAAIDPFLDQMRQYQTSLQDMYSQPRSGPFDFLNAPMTFNAPVDGQFRRPSYGTPEDRGFYPGGMPSFSAPPVPSGVEGLGGMFFDPYLATLAETLFGGASWLPEPKEPASPKGLTPAQAVPYSGRYAF